MPLPSTSPCSAPRRLKGSNASSSCCGAMPMPVSATCSATIAPCSVLCTCTEPPGRLNLMALVSRLISTWRSRTGSATTRPGSAPLCSCTRRSCASAATSGSVAGTKSAQASVCCARRRPPASARESSSTSSISASRWRPASSMCASQRWRRSRASALSSLLPRSSCVKPSTAFSGVRSSWLMRDMACDLAWLSATASARSCSACAATCDSVLSQLTPMRRSSRPCASSSGAENEVIQRSRPSGSTTRKLVCHDWPLCTRARCQATTASRSSGCRQAMASSGMTRRRSDVMPRRRNICASQIAASPLSSISQLPRPSARVVSVMRSTVSRSWRSVCCCSVMSSTTPSARRSGGSPWRVMTPRTTSQRSAPSAGRTTRNSHSSAPSPRCHQASACARTRARSSACTQRSSQSFRRSGPRAGSRPNSANMRAFQRGSTLPGSVVHSPMRAASAAASSRRAASSARRLPSTWAVTSSITPTKPTGVPSALRCSARRSSTWRSPSGCS